MRIRFNDELSNPKQFLFKILRKRLNNLPETIIHLINGGLFYYFVISLLGRYFEFETSVVISYVMPKQTRFPALTVCGCSFTSSICDYTDDPAKLETIKRAPIQSLFWNNITLPENELVISCHFINDSRRPNIRTACADIETVVESLHDDRKCFTYLAVLHDSISVGQNMPSTMEDAELGGGMTFDDYNEYESPNDLGVTKTTKLYTTTTMPMTTDYDDVPPPPTPTPVTIASEKPIHTGHGPIIAEVTEHFTSYIELHINFSRSLQRTVQRRRIQNADVVFAVHSDRHIPTMLDSDFQRLLPGFTYNIIFGKQITEFMPAPYKTNCRAYDKFQKPRSRNECVRLCIIMASLKEFGCLNRRALITPCWISYVETSFKQQSKNKTTFCNENRVQGFINYLKLRRKCFAQCDRDCMEENFNLAIEMTPFDGQSDVNLMDDIDIVRSSAEEKLHDDGEREHDRYGQDGRYDASIKGEYHTTVITIRSDRKSIENVKHHTELTLIELVGFLGGHAHIWLGISFISLYDIFTRLFHRAKLFVRSNVIVS